MHTVGEVARLAQVTVRALHHYDQIGLVRPSGRTDAGYRLYAAADLEQLQTVLFYRELGFPLEQISALLTDPDFDRGAALREQRALLEARGHHVQRMIRAIDDAIEAHENGTTMSEHAMFEVFGDEQRELQDEAEQRWGDTDAWAQSRRRTAHYTKADWEELKAQSEAINTHIVTVYRAGAAADSEAAMDAVEASRRQINDRFYDLPASQHVRLADMYVADPRFTATYDAMAEGLAVWVHDAIYANARRAGVEV